MIVVTGANGKLGGHAIKSLLEKVPAGQIVAAVRNTEKASSLTKLGVQVREADYTKPETLTKAFAGAEKVLLISSSEIGQRFAQHQHVIDAAVAAGVKLLVYTSILRADTSSLSLATEHLATEKAIQACRLSSCAPDGTWKITQNRWPLRHSMGLSWAQQKKESSLPPRGRTMPLQPQLSSPARDTKTKSTSLQAMNPSPFQNSRRRFPRWQRPAWSIKTCHRKSTKRHF
jgi:uncharacterized protein YbjT (DUF2867 family)